MAFTNPFAGKNIRDWIKQYFQRNPSNCTDLDFDTATGDEEIPLANSKKISINNLFPFLINSEVLMQNLKDNLPIASGDFGSNLYASDTTIASNTEAAVHQCNGTFNLTLPGTGLSGHFLIIKNVGSGTITLLTTSGQTIDGIASGGITLAANECIFIQRSAATLNWVILLKYTPA